MKKKIQQKYKEHKNKEQKYYGTALYTYRLAS